MIVTNKLFQIRLVTKFKGKWSRKLDFIKYDEKISRSLLILFQWEFQNESFSANTLNSFFLTYFLFLNSYFSFYIFNKIIYHQHIIVKPKQAFTCGAGHKK